MDLKGIALGTDETAEAEVPIIVLPLFPFSLDILYPFSTPAPTSTTTTWRSVRQRGVAPFHPGLAI